MKKFKAVNVANPPYSVKVEQSKWMKNDPFGRNIWEHRRVVPTMLFSSIL
ncbi:MAG: hypothetical protein U0T81_14745 [Saprospiraceae bacterium]